LLLTTFFDRIFRMATSRWRSATSRWRVHPPLLHPPLPDLVRRIEAKLYNTMIHSTPRRKTVDQLGRRDHHLGFGSAAYMRTLWTYAYTFEDNGSWHSVLGITNPATSKRHGTWEGRCGRAMRLQTPLVVYQILT
jgi:hypothetical protein